MSDQISQLSVITAGGCRPLCAPAPSIGHRSGRSWSVRGRLKQRPRLPISDKNTCRIDRLGDSVHGNSIIRCITLAAYVPPAVCACDRSLNQDTAESRTLRADAVHCSIPIVLMSSAEAPAEEGLWDAFFRKPVSWLAVAQTVRDLVEVPRVQAAATRGSSPAQATVPTSQRGSMPLVAMGDQPRNANTEEDPQDSRFTRTSTRESN